MINGEEGLILVVLRENSLSRLLSQCCPNMSFYENNQFRLHSPKIAQMEWGRANVQNEKLGDTAVIQVIYISTLKQVTLPRFLGRQVIYIALLDSDKSSVAARGIKFNIFL